MHDPTMAAVRAARKPRVPNKKPRIQKSGTPPPPAFDLDALPDSAFLTSEEVASVLRRSIATVRFWRQDPDHPLRWEYIDGKPLCRVRVLRGYIADRTSR
ncbi:hypothetical protein [Bradyrhizobium sp. UFLA05-112]